jgi:Hsp20/alpha crystallin family
VEARIRLLLAIAYLPASADTDKINANFANGTLRIDIAKRTDSRTKQIKIAEELTKGKKPA